MLTEIQDRIQSQPKVSIEDISNPLGDYIRSKKEWKPFPIADVNPDPFTEQTHKAVQKCIALALGLELPVGDLALEGCSWVDSQNYKAALTHNSRDELNHFEGFEIASVAYDMPLSLQTVVHDFTKELEALGEHPILMAGYLELSIFFTTLAMMRKYGSPGLKQLVGYVNRDESVHVNVNMYLVDKLRLQWKNEGEFNRIRESIIRWLVSDLPEKEQAKWLKSSEDLFNTRKAPNLEWTKAAQIPAFFELPAY